MSDYFNLNEGIKNTKKRASRFANFTEHKFFNKKAVIPLLILLVIPLTVGLALVEQETRSRAASNDSMFTTNPLLSVPKSTVPICVPLSIPPEKGPEPLMVTFYGNGISGGKDSLIDGYQWDFDGNGVWDSEVKLNKITHTYAKPGIYKPKYRILGSNGLWSNVCNYTFDVKVGSSTSAK